MLVLSRRREETIVIGGDVEIVVLHVGADSVKLGVRAPKSVPVYRGELYQQIVAHNRDAAVSAASTKPTDALLVALRNKKSEKGAE
jgi:carbon storage regulator